MYRVEKHYGHERGLSACFRQPGAASHCRHLHGYALAFTFYFECATLDANNWVVDFGSLAWLKEWLENTFDHKLLVAQDDPHLDDLTMLAQLDVADVLVVDAVGCESFARMAFAYARSQVEQLYPWPGEHCPDLVAVRVSEHSGNAAEYWGD